MVYFCGNKGGDSVKIEKGIEIPGIMRTKKTKTINGSLASYDYLPDGEGRRRKYPFIDMEVGDSIFFEGDFKQAGECPGYCAAKSWSNGVGRKITGKKVDGGVRVWRIK